MQVTKLFDSFNKLQTIYGDKNLDAIYGCGEINHPKICLVFMNPTARNISANKNWIGLKAPWIGTKHVWNMLHQFGIIKKDIIDKINFYKPTSWDYKFSETLYREIKNRSIYITNLSKATQIDARSLPNDIFKKYLKLFHKEIDYIKPKLIIAFGNQVSSVLLQKNIKVSEHRKKHQFLKVGTTSYKIFPVYYPVGQGMRNIKKAKEDMGWIINYYAKENK